MLAEKVHLRGGLRLRWRIEYICEGDCYCAGGNEHISEDDCYYACGMSTSAKMIATVPVECVHLRGGLLLR